MTQLCYSNVKPLDINKNYGISLNTREPRDTEFVLQKKNVHFKR